jgi:hypothetical protein
MLSPLNDLAVVVPVDPSLMEISKTDNFGLKSSKDTQPEEALKWRCVASGPGNYSSTGTLVPNPIHVGDVLVLGNASNRSLRENWAKATELLGGERYLLVRGFATNDMIVVVDREAKDGTR